MSIRQRRIVIMSNGTESYFPVLCRYRSIERVGPVRSHWQSAMKEGRRMARDEFNERKCGQKK
mgnify:CR=1 FL=1